MAWSRSDATAGALAAIAASSRHALIVRTRPRSRSTRVDTPREPARARTTGTTSSRVQSTTASSVAGYPTTSSVAGVPHRWRS